MVSRSVYLSHLGCKASVCVAFSALKADFRILDAREMGRPFFVVVVFSFSS